MPRPVTPRTRLTPAEAEHHWAFVTSDTGGGLYLPDAAAIASRAMSASTMNSMRSCPARWAAEKSLVETFDPFAAVVVGTAVHTALENLFARHTTDEARAWNVDDTDGLRSWFADEFARQAMAPVDGGMVPEADRPAWVSACLDAAAGYLRGDIEDPAHVDVLATEHRVDCQIGGIDFTGSLDRLVRDRDGRLIIDDYKTSKTALAYDDNAAQQQLYARALQEVGGLDGRQPSQARLLYVRLGETHPVDVSPLPVARAVQRLKDATQVLRQAGETGVFPATRVGWCASSCVLFPSCPSRPQHRTASGDLPRITLPVTDTAPSQQGATVYLDSMTMTNTPPTTPTTASHEPAWPIQRPDDHQERLLPPLRPDHDLLGLSEGRYATEMVSAAGTLNPGSYAVDAMTDLMSFATWMLRDSQLNMDLTSRETLMRVLARLCGQVQHRIVHSIDWQTRTNKLARTLVKDAIRTQAWPPFGGLDADWDAWGRQVVDEAVSAWSRMASILVDNIDDSLANPLPHWSAPARQWRVVERTSQC